MISDVLERCRRDYHVEDIAGVSWIGWKRLVFNDKETMVLRRAASERGISPTEPDAESLTFTGKVLGITAASMHERTDGKLELRLRESGLSYAKKRLGNRSYLGIKFVEEVNSKI